MPQLEVSSQQILELVHQLQPEDRQAVIDALTTGGPGQRAPAPRRPLQGLLGILRMNGDPPSDEECTRILKDELLRGIR